MTQACYFYRIFVSGITIGHILICIICVQILAALIVSLWQLIDGSCASIAATILYSWDRGSEEMSMSLEVAVLARKLS